ncbi:rod-determining factor RdfA [Haladaptatus sp. NG-SE-30]
MSNTNTRYKVPHVAAQYGIQAIEDDLAESWTQEDDPMSLRDLAGYFNRRMLRAAMESAEMQPLEGEVENTYQLLTDEDVSSGVYTETRRKLESNGIDVDQVESDFVSYQAVRTYLRNVRNVERERDTDAERVESVADSIMQLQNRTIAVTAEKLDQLDRTDRIDLGDFRVFLDASVFCEDCKTQYDVAEVLEQGGCQCESDSSDE